MHYDTGLCSSSCKEKISVDEAIFWSIVSEMNLQELRILLSEISTPSLTLSHLSLFRLNSDNVFPQNFQTPLSAVCFTCKYKFCVQKAHFFVKVEGNFNQVLCYNKTFNSELSEQRIPKYFCFYLIFYFLEIFFTNNFYKNYFRKILHSFSLAKLI